MKSKLEAGGAAVGTQIALAILILLIGAMSSLVSSQVEKLPSDDAKLAATLDQQLTDVYLHQDWAALKKIAAPDYSGFTADARWDFAAMEREFPKVHLLDLHVERQETKRLSPNLILINDVFTMHETYGGQDISGRYWSSDVWVHRDGKWLLLVEQEIPIK